MNSLNDIFFPDKTTRRIFFAGKGGVGKSSLAAITSVYTSDNGFKTLLVSTDPASHLSDVFESHIDETISPVKGFDNLYAVNIDPKKAYEAYKERTLRQAIGVYSDDMVKVMEEELNTPCTEEMATFQKFIDYLLDTSFDVVVFDTAPTGHTLRLLELPTQWLSELAVKKELSKESERLDNLAKHRFTDALDILKDKGATSFGFVTYPEETPIVEAHRAEKDLERMGIPTRFVVANMILPKERCVTPFFKKRYEMQQKYLNMIADVFRGKTVMCFPMLDTEIVGKENLKRAKEVLTSYNSCEFSCSK